MVGRRLISGRQALGVEYDLRDGLYAHLLRLSFGFYDRHQTGQLMSRATVDLQSVRFFLGYGLIFFFQHVLTIVGGDGRCSSSIEWRLALIALAITPLIVVVAYRYSHVSHPVLRDVQQKLGDVATVAEESIVGVHVVKAFAQEERRAGQVRARAPTTSSTRACARTGSARSTCRCSRSCRCSRRPQCCSPAGRMVVDGSLTLGEFFALQPAARDADLPAPHARHVDRPGAARDRLRRAHLRGDRRAGGHRRPAGRRRRCPPAPARSASSASASATSRAGRCSRRSTSRSPPAARSR